MSKFFAGSLVVALSLSACQCGVNTLHYRDTEEDGVVDAGVIVIRPFDAGSASPVDAGRPSCTGELSCASWVSEPWGVCQGATCSVSGTRYPIGEPRQVVVMVGAVRLA